MPEEKVSQYDRDEVKRLEREIELTGNNRFVGMPPAADAGPRQPLGTCGRDGRTDPLYNTSFHQGQHPYRTTCVNWRPLSPTVPQEAAPMIRNAIKQVRAKRGDGLHGHDENGWWNVADEIEQAVEGVLASRLLGRGIEMTKAETLKQERQLLVLAGRLCESQSPEWGDVDGATIEEWLLEAGLFKQIDVTEPCDSENCACVEFGFPGKCNRRTELGKRAIRLAAGGE